MGLRFRYPEPYVVETATTNPDVHQVAIDHSKEPGVLTIRFNPKDPAAAIELDEVAEATRQRMGVKAYRGAIEARGRWQDLRSAHCSR